MALHATPERHDADPPSGWLVVKVADRCWHLDSALGGTIDYFATRREAEAAKAPGSHLVTLYEQEGRWFAGDTPPRWRPYAEIVAERRRTHDRWHAALPSPEVPWCQFCIASSAATAAGR